MPGASLDQCAVPDCVKKPGDSQLFCRDHWKLVPNGFAWPLRRAYDNGVGAETEDFHRLLHDTVAEVVKRLEGSQEGML